MIAEGAKYNSIDAAPSSSKAWSCPALPVARPMLPRKALLNQCPRDVYTPSAKSEAGQLG